MRTPKALAALLSLLLLTASPASAQVRVEPVPGASVSAGGASGGSLGSLGGSSASPISLAPAALPGALALPSAAPALTPEHAAPAPAPTPSRSAAPTQTPAASPAAAAAPQAEPQTGPPLLYAQTLRELGVPAELTDRLNAFLASRHPGNQNVVYHGLGHSNEVATLE